jgi:DNA repair protein RadA/Sms
MPKTQVRFVCQSCGHESPRWLGRCPECDAWNSFVEEVRVSEKSAQLGRSPAASLPAGSTRPTPITRVEAQTNRRLSTGIAELDRVLGGGLVDGAVILVGGDPGIGKSTLMTQAASLVASGGRQRDAGSGQAADTTDHAPATVLYISGEESVQQIKLRSQRLGALADTFLVVNETDIGAILHHIDATKPDVVIVDSIQTTYDSSLESAPGTVSQIRDCAAALARVAKSGGPPIILIGHVTKEGSLAGPRVLEHMVDTVLYFEGDRHHAYRILRAVKNRFGSADEIGIFEMGEEGLREVENPSAVLLAERSADTNGSAVTATLEGSRPLLVEVQALVARSFLANPRRTATGIELNRLNMLLAVLEKRVGLRLGDQDVFVNVVGGVRVVEPATDLAVAMAVASNFREQAVDPRTIILGEIGLGGEVRAVGQTEKRIREASRLGFTRVVLSRHNAPRNAKALGVEILPVNNVLEAMREALLPAKE